MNVNSCRYFQSAFVAWICVVSTRADAGATGKDSRPTRARHPGANCSRGGHRSFHCRASCPTASGSAAICDPPATHAAAALSQATKLAVEEPTTIEPKPQLEPATDFAAGLLPQYFCRHAGEGHPGEGVSIRLPSFQTWESVPLWPHQGEATRCVYDDDGTRSAHPELFYLQRASQRFGGVVLQLQAANAMVQNGTLHLPPHIALVIDGDVEFRNVTFSGAPAPPTTLLRRHPA